MNGKVSGLIVVAAATVLVFAVAGYMAFGGGDKDPRPAIEKTLVGTQLTYSNIAGQPMNYTITQDDIIDIQPTTYKGTDAWKVRIGESLSWDLTMSADGTRVLETEQLFRT